MFFQESKDLFPAVDGSLLPIVRAVIVEESMPGAWVHVEEVILPIFFECFLVENDLFRGWFEQPRFCRRIYE